MTHPRSQIRNAIVTHLLDATAAEERVFAGRLMPIEEPELPALVVHTRDTEENRSRSTSRLNGFEQRRCIVTVVCIAQSFDDIDTDLDTIAGQVEDALQDFTIPGLESAELSYLDTRSDDPEFDGSLTTGASLVRYECLYMKPYRSGNDPYAVDDSGDLERSGAYPGGQITATGHTGAACPIGNATITINEEVIP